MSVEADGTMRPLLESKKDALPGMEKPDAFVGTKPVYEELRDELIEMTSQSAYDMVVSYLRTRQNGGATVPLAHPAVRSDS